MEHIRYRTRFIKSLYYTLFIASLLSVIIKLVLHGENIEKIMQYKETASGEWVNEMGEALDMKVMTYNIRHGRGLDGKVNLHRIVNDIRNSGADIVALQEVDRFNIRSKFIDQPSFLAKRTGLTFWSFSTSMRWGVCPIWQCHTEQISDFIYRSLFIARR